MKLIQHQTQIKPIFVNTTYACLISFTLCTFAYGFGVLYVQLLHQQTIGFPLLSIGDFFVVIGLGTTEVLLFARLYYTFDGSQFSLAQNSWILFWSGFSIQIIGAIVYTIFSNSNYEIASISGSIGLLFYAIQSLVICALFISKLHKV